MACIMSTYSRKKICCVRKDFRSPNSVSPPGNPKLCWLLCPNRSPLFLWAQILSLNLGTKLGNSSREKETVDPWLTLKHITWSPLFRILTYLVHVVSTNVWYLSVQFSSIVQSCPTLCDRMNCSTPGLPCPSPTPGVHSNSHTSGWWCHPAFSSSVVLFSSCPQSLPASVFSNDTFT